MLVLSAREASPPPEVRGFHGDRGVVEDRHGVEDRRFQEIEVYLPVPGRACHPACLKWQFFRREFCNVVL